MHNDKQLRIAIKGNAVFSALTGTSLLLLPQYFAKLFAINNHQVFTILGAGLLLFVLSLLYAAMRTEINKRQVWSIIVQGGLWVAGSLALLLIRPFGISFIGNLIIAFIAVIVGLLAIWQYWALRSMSAKTA